LNTLNYRVNGQLDVKGEIMINGVRANPKKMSMLSAYIQQDELFFGTLTVQEHLEFHVK
jgi:ABC-type multidrug transport system ATPase subunit